MMDIRKTCPICESDYVAHSNSQFQNCFGFIITALDSSLDCKRKSLDDLTITFDILAMLDVIQKLRVLK